MDNLKKEIFSKTPPTHSFVLRPSTIKDAGVGIFTIHNIKEGSLLHLTENDSEIRKIKEIHPELLKFCIFLPKGECECPKRFDTINVFWFINHSNTPNVRIRKHDRALIAMRSISIGEELFIDYHQFGEPKELQEDYYEKN